MPGRHDVAVLSPRGVECVAYRVAAKDARLRKLSESIFSAQRLSGFDLTLT